MEQTVTELFKTEILQDQQELDEYCALLKREGVRSYLEIGSKFGGSLWRAANALPSGSRVMCVDLPNGTKSWVNSRESLKSCVDQLRRNGYDAHVVWGSSQSSDVIRKCSLLGPYDAVMIDADHRMAGVTADWDNYHGTSRKIVSFHDISWQRAPDWRGTRIDVPQFWDSIKNDYRHEEIRRCPTKKNNGIGVLWKD